MSILLLLLTAMTLQSDSDFPHPEFAVKSYPTTAQIGNTIYMEIIAKNPHATSIFIFNNYLPTAGDIKIHFQDAAGQKQDHIFESLDLEEYSRAFTVAEIKPGESLIIAVLAISLPPLEDLKEPFWEKLLKNLSTENVEFTICVAITSMVASNKEGNSSVRKPFTLEVPIEMKQRPEKEMALFEDWYYKTPNVLFPMPEGENPPRKIPRQGVIPAESKIIRIQNKKYDPQDFIRLGNRYPAAPNAPETWQGWKELEESITPSTMRDEIRLTRILVQYCDTKDTKVLDELKKWFHSMNEVQRTVMAKNVCDLAWNSRGTDLFESFKKIYGTVKEYDIAAKAERMKKYLKEAGL